MIKLFFLLFILMFLVFTMSLCFAAAKEEKFYDKLMVNKKVDSDEK